MTTVRFQCSQCRKDMGVSSAYLGKQVRCPHCQAVVTAPSTAGALAGAATAPAPAPAPAPSAPSPRATPPDHKLNFSGGPPGRDEHESIFGENVAEDLFDIAPKAKIELPPEAPRSPGLSLEPTVFQMPGLPSQPVADPGPTVSIPTPESVMPAPTIPAAPPSNWNGSVPSAGSMTLPDAAAPLSPVTTMPTRPGIGGGNPALLYYALYILAGYALLMTIIALYYHSQVGKQPHPLEMMRDDGSPKSQLKDDPTPPAQAAAKTQSGSTVVKRIDPTTPLPPQLKLNLGETLTIGDLEVTPVKVEQKLINYAGRDGRRMEPADKESLVLTMKLKNVSKNTVFRPTDSSFDYEWRKGTDPEASLPYTHLAANGERFAGPLPWRPSKPDQLFKPRSGDNLRMEFIEGQKDDEKILQPGEEITTVFVTNPKDDVMDKLPKDFKDKMEWRVQLRRGLVPYEGKNYSCTALIGVTFDMSEVKKN